MSKLESLNEWVFLISIFNKDCVLRMLLVILHDPPLELRVLLRDELEGGQVGVVRVVLDHVIATFSCERLGITHTHAD